MSGTSTYMVSSKTKTENKEIDFIQALAVGREPQILRSECASTEWFTWVFYRKDWQVPGGRIYIWDFATRENLSWLGEREMFISVSREFQRENRSNLC